MKNKTALSIALALPMLFPTVAMADGPSWTFLQVSYLSSEVDELDVGDFDLSELDGFEVAGSVAIGEWIFLDMSYAAEESDDSADGFGIDFDLDRTRAGVGVAWTVADNTDLYGHIGYEDWSTKASAQGREVSQEESEDDNGATAAIGVRAMLAESFELRGEIGYNDIPEEATFLAGAYYTVAEHFTFGGSFEKIDEIESFRATARYSF